MADLSPAHRAALAAHANKLLRECGYHPGSTFSDSWVWDSCPGCNAAPLSILKNTRDQPEALVCERKPAYAACTADHIVNAARMLPPLVAEAPTEAVSAAADKPAAGFMTITEFVAGVEKNVPWLWHGFIARRAVTVLAAKPKGGKTTLLTHLLASVLVGANFAGRTTTRTRVLILSEEGRGKWQERLSLLPEDARGDFYIASKRDREFAGKPWGEVVEMAKQFCIDNDIGLLVVDVIDKWTGLGGDQENQTGAVVSSIQPVLQLAEQANVGVLLCTHTRKSEGVDGDQVKGSNALAGAVDIIVTLDRVPGHPKRRCLIGLGRYDAVPERWLVELDGGSYRSVGFEEDANDKLEAFVGEFANVAGGGYMSAPEFSPHAQASDKTVRRKLELCVEAGLLHRKGTGTKADPVRYGRLTSSATATGATFTSEPQVMA